jgi:hypothetical protein
MGSSIPPNFSFPTENHNPSHSPTAVGGKGEKEAGARIWRRKAQRE